MDLQSRAERVSHLLEDKMHVGGHGLKAKLARVGRRLPRGIRKDLAYLAEALEMEENPRLAPRIDLDRCTRAHDRAVNFLKSQDPRERQRLAWLDWVTGNAVNLLLLCGAVTLVLVWRGFL